MLFRINLATKIYVNTRLLRVSAVCIVIVCALILFFNITGFMSRYREVRNLSDKIAAMDVRYKTVDKGYSEKNYADLVARIDFANSIIERKMFNWLGLLDRLEKVVPEGVAISSVEPDSKTHTLKLSGVGRSFKNLRVFMENLESSRDFTDVYLLSHGNANLGDGTQGISFDLTCKAVYK